MSQHMKSLADLNHEAWRMLIEKLGVADALRFLGQFETGSGNYATDRDSWQKGLMIDEIAAGIERRRQSQKSGDRS